MSKGKMASTSTSSANPGDMPSPTFSTTSTAKSSAPSSRTCQKLPSCSDYNSDDDEDAAKDLKKTCHGWPELVDVMAHYPCLESFQAFRDLNIKSLLYYQAELDLLRKELHALEWQDHRKGGKSALVCGNVRFLLQTRYGDEGAQAQLTKMKEIRVLLKEYNAALLQYAQINKLPEPETFNVKTLRKLIDANIGGTLDIVGPGANSWGVLAQDRPPEHLWSQFWNLLQSIFCEDKPDEEDLDLVTPHKRKNEDSLTRWVSHHGLPFWHNLSNAFRETTTYTVVAPVWHLVRHPFTSQKKKQGDLPGPGSPGILSPEKNRTPSNASTLSTIKRWFSLEREALDRIREEDELASLSVYRMRGLIRFTNYVATIIACLLPIVGIVVLSKLDTRAKILGFIALFTALFAMGIMILTDASTSRTEIFTATAAFAAVLVVFVQNQASP